MRLDKNWGRRLGGKNLIKNKIIEGTLKSTILLLNKKSSEWHKKMRLEVPESYYSSQYEKFKKIAHYKFKTKQGIQVRNILEKEVADFLFENKINFLYEPFVKIGEKCYFPDFMIGKTIIEVTFWKNPSQEKISYLNEKIKNYIFGGYQVIFFIPDKYHKFYKSLSDCELISNLSDFTKIMPL